MANLPEADEYPVGIYQIETTDPVLGGPPNAATKAGLANIAAQQLAKRTHWLKTRRDQTQFAIYVDDWNEAVTNGVYRNSSSTNAPDGRPNLVGIVTAYSASFVQQTVWTPSSVAAADTLTWRRDYKSGVWGAWYRLRQSEAEIAALHSASLASNGWCRMPNGLVLQWGSAAGGNGASISFPISFPTACAQVMVTDANSGIDVSTQHVIGIASRSASGFSVSLFKYDGSAGSSSFHYLAVGY